MFIMFGPNQTNSLDHYSGSASDTSGDKMPGNAYLIKHIPLCVTPIFPELVDVKSAEDGRILVNLQMEQFLEFLYVILVFALQGFKFQQCLLLQQLEKGVPAFVRTWTVICAVNRVSPSAVKMGINRIFPRFEIIFEPSSKLVS